MLKDCPKCGGSGKAEIKMVDSIYHKHDWKALAPDDCLREKCSKCGLGREMNPYTGEYTFEKWISRTIYK